MPAFAQSDTLPSREGQWGKDVIDKVYQQVKKFSHIDTTYVEAQKYNFTAMIQNVNTYEIYQVSDNQGQSIRFSPRTSIKVGPYFGWRWIVLGYTIDFSHLASHQKQDFTLSIYSNQVGADLFYRKTGHDYRLRQIRLGNDIDTSPLVDIPFDGVYASIKGFNLYYIFNHRKFSYPAAYSQSTRQLRSAGSALAGIGFTRHSLIIDWDALEDLIEQYTVTSADQTVINEDMKFSRISYNDLSAYLGYSYNWVFAPRWLFNSSLSLGLGYKRSSADVRTNNNPFKGFSFHNFNLDGIGRFALVYNNSRWYAGSSATLHAYSYKKKTFQTNNVFGNVTFYVGFNFGRR